MRHARNPQMELGEIGIEDIWIDLKSRDDISALLLGLQHLYADEETRTRLFALLEEHMLPGVDRTVGRPGMEMWMILVMVVVMQGLVYQANWQKAGGASPLERRSNQTTFLREPCVGPHEGASEASVAVRMGRAIEQRKACNPECRGFQSGRRQHRRHRFGEMSADPAVSESPCTSARLLSGPWEVFKLPRTSLRGRVGNGENRSL